MPKAMTFSSHFVCRWGKKKETQPTNHQVMQQPQIITWLEARKLNPGSGCYQVCTSLLSSTECSTEEHATSPGK